MMFPSEVDYIIVGQGLAGSSVAVRLISIKKRILVIDSFSPNAPSTVAAGMFNPVTGRKMIKTWLADELFTSLFEFYKHVETKTTSRFFSPMPVYRPFVSVEEQNEWIANTGDPAFADYILSVSTQPSGISGLHDPLGGLTLKRCGFLNTTRYLDAVRQWIKTENFYGEEIFDMEALTVNKSTVTYKNCTAKAVIFCEGNGVRNNRWFNWLPVMPLQGEALTVQTMLPGDLIINRGIYVIPSGMNEFYVGSTYRRNEGKPETDKGFKELMEKLEGLISIPYEVIDRSWGLRPTTPDRRPILGAHPEMENLIIFNGLGTKGVSLSPYFSEVLVRWLENRGDINKEVDISRYKSLY